MKVFVRAYRGTEDEAYAAFQEDAELLADDGWEPTNQQWHPASSTGAAALIAWISWVWIKKPGALWVTYQADGNPGPPEETFEEWVYRVGVQEARATLEDEVRDRVISRAEYNDHVAEIDRLQLD